MLRSMSPRVQGKQSQEQRSERHHGCRGAEWRSEVLHAPALPQQPEQVRTRTQTLSVCLSVRLVCSESITSFWMVNFRTLLEPMEALLQLMLKWDPVQRGGRVNSDTKKPLCFEVLEQILNMKVRSCSSASPQGLSLSSGFQLSCAKTFTMYHKAPDNGGSGDGC